MIIVWCVLTILIIMLTVSIMLILSTIQFEINNFIFDSTRPKKRKISKYRFIIKLKLFNKLTWVKIKLNKDKIKEIKNSKILKNILLKGIKDFNENKDIEIKELKVLKSLNITTEKLKLYVNFDTNNIGITTFLTAVTSTVISIFLAKTAKKNKIEDYMYKIEPSFYMQNLLKICIDCIISLKMVHIINIIYILKKKRSVKKYDKRTSNRRAYAYSNE